MDSGLGIGSCPSFHNPLLFLFQLLLECLLKAWCIFIVVFFSIVFIVFGSILNIEKQWETMIPSENIQNNKKQNLDSWSIPVNDTKIDVFQCFFGRFFEGRVLFHHCFNCFYCFGLHSDSNPYKPNRWKTMKP